MTGGRLARGGAGLIALLCGALVAASSANAELNRLTDIRDHFGRCFRAPPEAASLARIEVTIRFTLRRDGHLVGAPRVTFVSAPRESDAGRALAAAAVDAITSCTPAPLSPGLAGAIAGRPYALRFIAKGGHVTAAGVVSTPTAYVDPAVQPRLRGLGGTWRDPTLRPYRDRPARLRGLAR